MNTVLSRRGIQVEATKLAQWRLNRIALLRILFGMVWGIDAWFKWQPDFVNNFTTFLAGAQDGQPWPIHHWIRSAINTAGIDRADVCLAVMARASAGSARYIATVAVQRSQLVPRPTCF